MLSRFLRLHVARWFLISSASLSWVSQAVQQQDSAPGSGEEVWSPPIVSRCKCGAGVGSGGGDAFQEAREVRQLSDQLEKAEVILKGWKLKLLRAKEYHEKQEKILKHQKAVNDRAPKAESSVKRDEDYYYQRMCSLVTGARVMEDKDAEKQLMDLCLERKTLALSTANRSQSADSEGCDCSRASSRHAGLALLAKSRRATVLAAAADPEQLKQQLKAINEQIVKAREEYFAKPEEWRLQREGVMEELAKANEARFSAMDSQAEAQKKAYAAVRERVCAMIDGGAPTEEILSTCPA